MIVVTGDVTFTLVVTTVVTEDTTVVTAGVVAGACGAVVNMDIVQGPVAVMAPVELMVTALTSHQYTVLYCKVS